MTPRAQELVKTIESVNRLVMGGLTPFQAMASMLDDNDWVLAYVAFRALVKEAAEA